MIYLERNRVHVGDVRELAGRLEPASVQTIVTSPPYFGLRSYLPGEHEDKHRELGSDPTPAEYVANLVAVFRALRDCLKDDGTCWINLGDSFGEGKQLQGIPWRVAFGLQADGWVLRSDCIWAKPAPMPESVRDRPTRSHEYIFLLAKGPRYFYDAEAIREPLSDSPERLMAKEGRTAGGRGNLAAIRGQGWQPSGNMIEGATMSINPAGRNKRSVWTVTSAAFPDAHYATFPPDLIRPCVLAGTSERGECAACGRAWVRDNRLKMRDNLTDEERRYVSEEMARYANQGVRPVQTGEVGARVPAVRGATGWAATKLQGV